MLDNTIITSDTLKYFKTKQDTANQGKYASNADLKTLSDKVDTETAELKTEIDTNTAKIESLSNEDFAQDLEKHNTDSTAHADIRLNLTNHNIDTSAHEDIRKLIKQSSGGGSITANFPNLYQVDTHFYADTTASRTTLATPNDLWVNVNGSCYVLNIQQTFDLSSASSWG